MPISICLSVVDARVYANTSELEGSLIFIFQDDQRDEMAGRIFILYIILTPHGSMNRRK